MKNIEKQRKTKKTKKLISNLYVGLGRKRGRGRGRGQGAGKQGRTRRRKDRRKAQQRKKWQGGGHPREPKHPWQLKGGRVGSTKKQKSKSRL